MQYSERRQCAIQDQSVHGDYVQGKYNGFKWEAIRCYGGTSPPPKRWDIRTAPIHHWCGYITIPNYDPAKEEQYRECFKRSECTCQRDNVLGFDLGHCEDVEVYRTFPYTLSVIQDIIDNLIKLL